MLFQFEFQEPLLRVDTSSRYFKQSTVTETHLSSISLPYLDATAQ